MQALYSVKHQTVTLEVDFNKKIVNGITEILIQPKSDKINFIYLNCENPPTLNGSKCKFTKTNLPLPDGNPSRLSSKYDLVKTTGLEIEIPSSVLFETTNHGSALPDSTISKHSSFRVLSLKIWFQVSNLNSGLVYINNQNSINNTPIIYSETDIRPGSPRKWLPTVDQISERMTWDLRYIVPKSLPSNHSDTKTSFETVVVSSGELVGQAPHPTDPTKKIFNYLLTIATPACALAFVIGGFDFSLRLSDPSALPNSFDLSVPIPENKAPKDKDAVVSEKNSDSNENPSDTEVSDSEKQNDESKALSTYKSLKARKDALENIGGVFVFGFNEFNQELFETCSFVCDALAFHSTHAGSYPFTMYKIVFFDGLGTSFISGASITLASIDLLYPKEAIEPVYLARKSLSLAIAQQWFGVYILFDKWSDQWLIIGLASFASSMYLKKNLGTNEYLFCLKKDLKRLCFADVNQKPVSYIDQPCILDPAELEFMQLKSPIILYMLDQRMMKRGSSLGLMRVIPRLLVLALGNEIGASNSNSLSTSFFLKLCKKVSGIDLKDFADQWIFGTGCPIFKFSYAFNRKKLVVELNMIQESSNTFATAPYSKKQIFTGQMTARVREADGTPYEHVLDINSAQQKFEVQFNTKYKRIRRSTKRFHLRQMAAAAEEMSANAELLGSNPNSVLGISTHNNPGGQNNPSGANPNDEDDYLNNDLYSNIALFGAENEEDKRNWRVVEWGENDEESLASSTFEWIRIDSDMEWACIIYFEQPDYMWAAQLQKDRDVVAQMEAVEALESLPSSAASTTLMRTIMDSRVFYRFATDELDSIGLYHLVKIYKNRFCMLPQDMSKYSSPFGDDEDIDIPRIPKRNNFSNFSEYFTLKAIISSLSNITASDGTIPVSVKNILYNCLKYNDNGENLVITNAVSRSLYYSRLSKNEEPIKQSSKDCSESLHEINRMRRLDALIPSYKNIITVSSINAFHQISLVSKYPGLVDPMQILSYTLPKNYTLVRISAIRLLASYFGVKNPQSISYLFSIASFDSNLEVSLDSSYTLLLLYSFLIINYEHELNSKSGTIHFDSDRIKFGKGNRKDYETELENIQFLDHSEKQFPARNLITGYENFLTDTVLNSSNQLLLEESLANISLEISHKQNLNKLLDILFTKPKIIEEKSLLSAFSVLPGGFPGTKKLKIRIVSNSDKRKSLLKDQLPSHRKTGSISDRNIKDRDTYSQRSTDRFSESIPLSKQLAAIEGRRVSSNLGTQPFPSRPSTVSIPNIKLVIKNPSSANVASMNDDSASKGFGGYSLQKSSIKKKSRTRHRRNSSDVKLASLLELGSIVGGEDSSNINSANKSYGNYISSNDISDEDNGYANVPLSTILSNRPKILKIKLTSTKYGIGADNDIDKKPFSHLSTSQNLETMSTKPTNDLEIKKMKRILKRVSGHRSAGPFLRPVDPILDGCPLYFEIIKNPMDISTIQAKVESGKYPSMAEFETDFRLILSNCFEFNPVGTLVHDLGLDLEKFFNKVLKETEKSKKPVVKIQNPISTNPTNGLSSSLVLDKHKELLDLNPVSLALNNSRDSSNQLAVVIDNSKNNSILDSEFYPEQVSDDSAYPKIKRIKLYSSKYEISTKPRINNESEEELDLLSLGSVNTPKEPVKKLSLKFKNPLLSLNSSSKPKPKSKSKSISIIKIPNTIKNDTLENQVASSENNIHASNPESKLLMRILRKLQTHPSSIEFLYPVDPIKQSVPHYFDIIKKPMDLSTIESKLTSGKYLTKEMFFDDVNLIVKNCFLFNPEGSFVYEQAKSLFSFFQSLWKKEVESKSSLYLSKEQSGYNSPNPKNQVDPTPISTLSNSSKLGFKSISMKKNINSGSSIGLLDTNNDKSISRITESKQDLRSPAIFKQDVTSVQEFGENSPRRNSENKTSKPQIMDIELDDYLVKKCKGILSKLTRKQFASPFLTPVDPIALGIPTYFDIIKHPMDFLTIKTNLSNRNYSHVSDFLSDIQLIFDNCFLFNPPDSWVYDWGKKLHATFVELVRNEGWEGIM
ncbi:hypothetical protein BB560_000795 [Smittium megazygosporum]|uniref:Transcription initiation factor TFIID subunit 2 n=1 Tax=Smittium megazygosporum TaxID=133381 RepID=A0A2T9ZJA5_9FUNG|nr:hypothetical protein BB560_000795 [Smittium megazygosporum]